MALVRKILETTLTAGSTSVTFTDTDIPNSLLRVYCTKASLFPLSQTLSGNVLSVNYKAQSENVGVALEIVKQGLDIVDGLTSEDATKALSANQGYILKGLIDDIVIPTVPENITDLDDVEVTSIQDGQVLAWNSVTEKFENVNQSGGSSGNDYTTNEVKIGTFLGADLYRKTIDTGAMPNTTTKQVAHGISGLNFIRSISGAAKNPDYSYFAPLPYVQPDDTYQISIYVDATNINIMSTSNMSGYSQSYITLEYTKTS